MNELDGRSSEVLRTVIRQHILSGEPVGSKAVTGGTMLDLSPASIRNVMAELEERGLLQQPHTSAGRVPTDQAYRLYVDQMLRKTRLSPSQAQAIDTALADSRGEIPDLLAEVSRQLSQFSKQVGLVLAPNLQRVPIDRIEFVRLDSRRVVAILVARSGVVHNRVLEIAEPAEQVELDRIGRYLTDELGGLTLPEMRDRLLIRMGEERAAYDRLMMQSLELGRQALESREDDAELLVEGASNLIGSPEFSELGAMRDLFRTLEEKKALIQLLSQVIDGEGVQVVIGAENPQEQLSKCSLVVATYGTETQTRGTLGIVGPTRMEYAKAIALVEHLAGVLSGLLSGPGD
ncbi:MAG: heat-inducible transcription repressor HrcA [Acidobacteria bacterium]|nr:MAG: heat-inducible transcription repressor HrcA [Acidobacteriota bacterium]